MKVSRYENISLKLMSKTIPTWVNNLRSQDLSDRGLSKEVLDKYGVKVSVDETTGEIDSHFYPYYKGSQLSGYKQRKVSDKSFFALGDLKNCQLFGQQLFPSGGRLLIIVEGECDALAASQMLSERGKNYSVVSLPTGANIASVKQNLEYIQSFDVVMLGLDQDEPGRAATQDICALLKPGQVKILNWSEKDANDLLKAGKSGEFWNSLFRAREYRPDGIVGVEDLMEEALRPIEWGLSWPWQPLTEATYGIRRKEIYGFGAGSGCGKTEGFKEIINHIIQVHQLPAGVIFLEENAAKTLKVLAGKKLNKRFHIPDADWTIEELQSGLESLTGKVYLYNHFGAKEWDSIKSKIRYMVNGLGIKDIFLDHLTALVAREQDENKAMNRIMEEMSSLAEEINCTIYFISHLRKSNSGKPHEEGARVYQDDFRGSAAIGYWSHLLIGYERDTQNQDPIIRNTTTVRVLKDRATGLATGMTFELFFDHKTGRWEVVLDNNQEDDEYEI